MSITQSDNVSKSLFRSVELNIEITVITVKTIFTGNNEKIEVFDYE